MSKYLVVDLEMCRTPKGIKKGNAILKNELIQIGAVLLDENLKVYDNFMTYVAPSYSRINPFIQKLTGISQKDLTDAPSFEKAIEMFASWIPDDTTVVTWSENDANQIIHEASYKGVSVINLHVDEWHDCQKTFSEKMNTKKIYSLFDALSIANIFYDEGFHDALVDAKNTALLFTKMQKESKLVLNPYYTLVSEEETTISTVSNLLCNYKNATVY